MTARPTSSVLVIEDDEQLLAATRAMLERRGWHVTGAVDPWVGLAACERERPDLVLLDHDLPGLSGLRLLELLRERDRDATIVMLTGHGDIPLAVEAMRLGAENFLSKPIDPDQLEAALQLAMEKAEMRRRSRDFREHPAQDAVDQIRAGRAKQMEQQTAIQAAPGIAAMTKASAQAPKPPAKPRV